MKIVINNCFGGYGLSQDFLEKYGEEFNSFERNDPKLVAAVEEFDSLQEFRFDVRAFFNTSAHNSLLR